MIDDMNPRQPKETPDTAATPNSPLDESDAFDDLMNAAPDDDAPHFLDDPLATGEMDIDAALAAVAALQDIVSTEDEADDDYAYTAVAEVPAVSAPAAPEITEEIIDDDDMYADSLVGDDGEAVTVAPMALPVSSGTFARPPLMTMHRGQAASVVPAIVLMALGAWLTFALVTNVGIPASQLPGLVLGAGGIMLLAQWLTSERWARGSFFMGALLILIGASILYVAQPDSVPNATFGLVPAALGIAILLTGLFTPPRSGRLVFVGLALTAAGIAALLFLGGFVPADVVTLLTSAAPLIGILALVIVALPLIRRR